MEVNVLGSKYRLESVDGNLMNIVGLDGLTLLEDKRILIESSLEGLRLQETVIHEILHAIWHEARIGYSDRTEEKIVTALAAGICSLISNNSKETVDAVLHGRLRGKKNGNKA